MLDAGIEIGVLFSCEFAKAVCDLRANSAGAAV
jgi:hypothetical protein